MKRLSFEVPIKHLDYFHPYQDFSMLLVHLMGVEEYRKYARSLHGSGNLIILDNSYNETNIPTDMHNLLIAEMYLKPHLVVAPDCNDWDIKTTIKAFKDLKNFVPIERILALFRSPEEHDALRSEGALYLGASYYWRKDMPYLEKNIFRFGFLDLKEAIEDDFIMMDTSLPVKLAWDNVSWIEYCNDSDLYPAHLEAGSLERIVQKEEYFNAEFSEGQLKLAVRNILRMKETLNGPSRRHRYRGSNEGTK